MEREITYHSARLCSAVSTVRMAGDAASVAGDTANTSRRHRVVCDVTLCTDVTYSTRETNRYKADVKFVLDGADVLTLILRLLLSTVSLLLRPVVTTAVG